MTVRDACLSLARLHGVERVECDTSVLDATVGGFLIWFTAWDPEVTELDIWCAALGGVKLMNLLWAGDEFELRTFKRMGEWVPQLLAMARQGAGTRLH